MARINKAALVADIAQVAVRAHVVAQDPAVAKAARVALDDVIRAGHSTADLGREVVDAWNRAAPAARRI